MNIVAIQKLIQNCHKLEAVEICIKKQITKNAIAEFDKIEGYLNRGNFPKKLSSIKVSASMYSGDEPSPDYIYQKLRKAFEKSRIKFDFEGYY